MCIVFVCTSSPRYSLVVASNRDEFLGRPTAALAWQDGAREPFVAGRDLSAGGTWLGITRSGRWGVLTNFTEPASAAGTTVRSRGELVSDWLASDASVAAHATGVRPGEYAGFSVLLGDAAAPETPATVWYVSNRAVKPSHRVEAETFGLSNSTLLEPWPKVEAGRAAFSRALEGAEGEEALIDGCWKVLR
jgi:uncharacterized protein with NRDE domain